MSANNKHTTQLIGLPGEHKEHGDHHHAPHEDPFKKSQRLPALSRIAQNKNILFLSPISEVDISNFYHL